MIFIDIIIWVSFWLIVWGGYFYLIRRRINYISRPVITSAYFLIFSLPAIYVSKELLIPLLKAFSIIPFVVLFFVLVGTVVSYHFSKKHLQPPTKLIEKYPNASFLRMDYRYVISKSCEIFFQQVMIVIFVLLLIDYGLSIWQIILTFLVFFGVVHVPLIKLEGKVMGYFFTLSSLVSALVFPPLILLFNYGFVYSYTVHWAFYTFSAVLFWKYWKN